MHKPKLGKKCYDCYNRFICWTHNEEPEVVGLPLCSRCHSQLMVSDVYTKNMLGKECVVAKARCPHHKFYSWHDGGAYMNIVWVRLYDTFL